IVRAVEALASRDFVISRVDPTPSGRVDPAAIDAATRGVDVAAIVLQAVNHETGVIQPIAEAAAIARAKSAWLVVDAVQAAGRLDPKAWEGADIVTIAAHKIR